MKKWILLMILMAILPFQSVSGAVKSGPNWSGFFETSSWYLIDLDRDKDTNDQMAFFAGYFGLDMEVKLEDNIDILASLKFEQIFGSGAWNGVDSDSDMLIDTLSLRKACVVFNEFLWPFLTVTVGRQVDSYSLLDNGNGSLMFDSRWLALNDSDGVDGFKFNINTDNHLINVFMYTYKEATPGPSLFNLAGNNTGDNALLGAQWTWDFNVEGTNKLYLLALQDRRGAAGSVIGENDRTGTNVISLDVGGSYSIAKNMLLYGQFAINTGTHWIDADLDELMIDNEKADVSGTAIQLGFNYQLGNATYVWIQVDIISGDDPGTADKYEGFLAPAESQELTQLVEGNYVYNRNDNMTAIRMGGTYTVKDFEYGFTLGIYNELEDTLSPGLGMELDFSVEWAYSDNVYLSAVLAIYQPDGDYADKDMGILGLGKISVEF